MSKNSLLFVFWFPFNLLHARGRYIIEKKNNSLYFKGLFYSFDSEELLFGPWIWLSLAVLRLF